MLVLGISSRRTTTAKTRSASTTAELGYLGFVLILLDGVLDDAGLVFIGSLRSGSLTVVCLLVPEDSEVSSLEDELMLVLVLTPTLSLEPMLVPTFSLVFEVEDMAVVVF